MFKNFFRNFNEHKENNEINIFEILYEIAEKTIQPFLKIGIDENIKPTVFESKFSGIPYIPRENTVPVSKDGKQMKLLAQINCTDLMMLKDFPHEGLLQFYIAIDDLFGLNSYEVVYYDNIDFSITEQDILPKLDKEIFEAEEFPVQKEKKINFSLSYEPVSYSDYKFDNIFCDVINKKCPKYNISSFLDLQENQQDILLKKLDGSGSKISGYPFFTQDDPRKNEDYDILLLQIDSDDNDILWGDCGVANFFISREDLLHKDFSNVFYTWDCC